jgi:DNA uptake protein ComE-like DNA-binding protein
MPAPPQLTPEQRQAALAKAAEARKKRAELKNQLKMGTITLSDLFAQSDTNDIIAKTKVISVLESLPGVGKVKARRIMEDHEISETRKIRGLGAKQREALLAEFA